MLAVMTSAMTSAAMFSGCEYDGGDRARDDGDIPGAPPRKFVAVYDRLKAVLTPTDARSLLECVRVSGASR